ncbi:energy transducer TonB [Hymenobacter sp. GOD-10R]|uniref:energy transducer TonB n=1 Tax=Hymenobacter sp. GOD-10R TaxID=3093922 RepID=UPI002D77D7ED|nr:energy transducer TonB [Hymenobacter sp. GOD-10R]WRQ28190.1 energy transducer TonB [Hymenobacter sp. GOD-10R]
MKHAIICGLALLVLPAAAQSSQQATNQTATVQPTSSKRIVYSYVEHLPNYPNGGLSGALRYFAQNVNLPEEVKSGRVQGRVFVSFVVDETGKVQDATVMRGLSPAIDSEALRVVRSMSQWIPGSQNGINVAVSMTVPVMFSLTAPEIPNNIQDLSSVCQ